MSEHQTPLEIVIDAVAFEDALEAFKAQAEKLIGEHAENLAVAFRDRVIQAICAQVDGRPITLTIKATTESEDSRHDES